MCTIVCVCTFTVRSVHAIFLGVFDRGIQQMLSMVGWRLNPVLPVISLLFGLFWYGSTVNYVPPQWCMECFK